MTEKQKENLARLDNELYEMPLNQEPDIVTARLQQSKKIIDNEYEDLLKIKSAYALLIEAKQRILEIKNGTVKVSTRKEASNQVYSSKRRQ
jgi:hypothetical protein